VSIRFKTFVFEPGDTTLYQKYVATPNERVWVFNNVVGNSLNIPAEAVPAFNRYDKLPVVVNHGTWGTHHDMVKNNQGQYETLYRYAADKHPSGIVTTNSDSGGHGYHIYVPEYHPLFNTDIYFDMGDEYLTKPVMKRVEKVERLISSIIFKPLIDEVLKRLNSIINKHIKGKDNSVGI
jgi:hypothetical protein